MILRKENLILLYASIKSMDEMPKSCWNCNLCLCYKAKNKQMFHCIALNKQISDEWTKDNDCPLNVEIPMNVETKVAEWISEDEDNETTCVGSEGNCSNCGKRIFPSSYCPHCGARLNNITEV